MKRMKIWLLATFALVVFLRFADAGQVPMAAGAPVTGSVAEPATQKKFQSESARKTVKIYKALRPEEAARLIDRLDEKTAADILNSLDQKTVTKLIPYLNQPRVLKWTRETMAGR